MASNDPSPLSSSDWVGIVISLLVILVVTLLYALSLVMYQGDNAMDQVENLRAQIALLPTAGANPRLQALQAEQDELEDKAEILAENWLLAGLRGGNRRRA